MPANKDLKRLIRRRMQKTGEAYTTARAHLLKTPKSVAPFSPPGSPVPASAGAYATLAGMSDATIKKATGCTWKRWVDAYDYAKAYTWSHRDIAEYAHAKFKIPDWWAQTVAVGYERIKGLRAIGQRRDGTFEATKSKVFPVPLARLFRAWSDTRTRMRWLPEDLMVRTATRGKSMRITWPDRTSVQLNFTRKSAAKAQVHVQHSKLPDKPAATKMKAFWTERLAALEEVLTQ